MKAKLIAHTPNPDKVVAMSAKLCYSPIGVEEMSEKITDEQVEKFLKMLISLGHESPIEHVSFTFSIEGISRACSHQLVRHRLASYCVSKDTRIYTSSQRTNRKTIEELYNLPKQYKQFIKVKCIDERVGDLHYNSLKNIIYSGIKPVFEVKTAHGYSIKTTLEHKFFTENGWKELKNLKSGDFVYINGEPLYKDKDWLNHKYNVDNLSQEEISEICGSSKHTIRAWIRRYNLQKEPGSWSIGVEPPNKGKTKDNYPPLKIVSEKSKGNKNCLGLIGEKNPNYKWDNVSVSGGYGRSNRYKIKKGFCELCGFEGVTETHHLDKNPINSKDENLIELCIACHKAIHKQETKSRAVASEIISIGYIGDEETYDIEMTEPHHNFIANGFVVHNSQQSQRYVKLEQFEYVIPKAIEYDEQLKEIFIKSMNRAQEDYNKLVAQLIESGKTEKEAIEDARYVFPNACETKMVVTMNARSLFNFFNHRCCERAQWEIRELAEEMLKECKKVAPILFSKAGAPCVNGSCPEGKMSCGNPKKGL